MIAYLTRFLSRISRAVFHSTPKASSALPLAIALIGFLLIAPALRAQPVIKPSPPQLSAKSYLLMDARTGDLLIEHNIDEQLPPASLTKMMTSFIASEEIARGRLKYSDKVLITDNAWKKGGAKSGGSTMFLNPRTEVSVAELLRGIIIQSGNDAAIAIAEHIAGGESAFADVMNQQAQELGMYGSRFENATGWPAEGHVSTARDLALLAQAIIYRHPEDYALYKEKSYEYNGIKQNNRNRLLFRDKSVDGLKTGHTEAAGYCLVSSAERDGMRLITVVMGTASDAVRAEESQKLLSYGFRYYETAQLFAAGHTFDPARVWAGEEESVKLALADELVLTIPRGARDSLTANASVDSTIMAPIEKGQALGELVISLKGETLATRPLVADAAVEEAGFFGRLWDRLMLKFE